MTLRELAGAHNGSITMTVYASADDEKPLVTFQSNNYGAIKDEILDKEVDKYTVKTLILYSELSVVLVSDALLEDVGTEDTEASTDETTAKVTG